MAGFQVIADYWSNLHFDRGGYCIAPYAKALEVMKKESIRQYKQKHHDVPLTTTFTVAQQNDAGKLLQTTHVHGVP